MLKKNTISVLSFGCLAKRALLFKSRISYCGLNAVAGNVDRRRREEGPILFDEIEYLDETISKSMRESYEFFRQLYLEEWESEEWGNCCVHCGAMQEADGGWRYGDSIGTLF